MNYRERGVTVSSGLLRGALAGALGGVFFIGVAMWYANSTGNAFYRPLEFISSLVLDPATTSTVIAVTLGAAMHAALSVAFGSVFGLIATFIPTNRAIVGAAVAYGAALYLFNFLVLPQWIDVFAQFDRAVKPLVFSMHVLFGLGLATGFLLREVPSAEATPATIRQREDARIHTHDREEDRVTT